MNEKPDIMLDHVNLPARRPEWLADWYADNLGLKAGHGFVFGPGTLIVFESGEPVDYHDNVHLGFRCNSRHTVVALAEKLRAALDQAGNYCAFKSTDPEGNVFEVYWEE